MLDTNIKDDINGTGNKREGSALLCLIGENDTASVDTNYKTKAQAILVLIEENKPLKSTQIRRKLNNATIIKTIQIQIRQNGQNSKN